MISAKCPHSVHQKVVDGAVSGVLKLADILEFIIYTFYYCPFPEHDLVSL